MINASIDSIRPMSLATLSLLAWQLGEFAADANPTGGAVAQGSATFSSSGTTFTINQTSANALINWSTFNIANGETTTFVQPSSTSLVWNQINDSSPSQILGNLNANGYVILQNQNGFYVGGNAAISAHGLVMTTSPTPAPTLSSSTWEFDTPPVGSDIINYGKINIAGGGFAYLIADGIQNYGTIEAEQGKIGLYDGEKVLLSPNADGHGISARVTLPAGSVDNEGHLVADGGMIAAMAQTVNQNGLVQANAIQNVNGVIELVASGNLNLGTVPNAANPNPTPDIEANGDASSANASPGGFVVLQGANFSDTASSKINVSGQNGGQDGIVEVLGNNLTGPASLNSQIGNNFALLVNPYDLTVSGNPTGTSTDANNNLDANFNVSDLAAYAQIDLHALDNIELSTSWTLTDPSVNNPGVWGSLSLIAGNSIIGNQGAGIYANNNWEVNLTAGTAFTPTTEQPTPSPGNLGTGDYEYGIYLNDSAYVQTQNGNINVWAANEVQIADDATAGSDGIRTTGGGSINVATEYGDVNTGGNSQGLTYKTDPYYVLSGALGGISTAAGGDVTITAGGNVYSYLPSGSTAPNDAGTGAFGPEPGNVTITAGGGIFGHYFVADGAGTITAEKGDVGTPGGTTGFALSLIAGSWKVNAPNGNIYLQEVRNPNGIFNKQKGTGGNLDGYHLFTYGADDSVTLDAGIGVYLTDENINRLGNANVPVIYPSILDITAGSGGVTLQGNVTLFPSPDQNLSITTTDGGSFVANPNSPSTIPELLMSDSSATRWTAASDFTDTDHGPLSAEPTDPTPVIINIAGDIVGLDLITTKETQITVGGNMINCGFSGQNLNSSDVTSITVNGQIYNQGSYTFVDNVTFPSVPVADVPNGLGVSWDDTLYLAVNPVALANIQVSSLPSLGSLWLGYILQSASVFQTTVNSGAFSLPTRDLGFVYDSTTQTLGFGGPMTTALETSLTQPLTILHLVNGLPVLDSSGHFETDTVSWAPRADIQTLFGASQIDPSPIAPQVGYRVGGPGYFNITAGSISLGDTYGILSCGVNDPEGGLDRYANLASITSSGATLNVVVGSDQTGTVTADGTTIAPHASLDMLTSTIASLGGGDVNVTSTGGSMDLGAQALYDESRQVGFGVFTASVGNVNVEAFGDINIDGSRIATYNGGNIFIESYTGSVDVGSGGDSYTGVYMTYVANGIASSYAEAVYGSGIVANTLVPASTDEGYPPADSSVTIAKNPGDITVETPQGNISATLGGVTQEALDGTTAAGPTITLEAGTKGVAATTSQGNINLGDSGVIGGSVSITATGDVSGPIIARQNANVQAVGTFNGSVLAGGTADVSGSSVSGVIVGVGGVSVSGTVNAEVLGQNVSVNGGASQSTLGSSAAATSTSGSAAQQASADTKQEVASNSTDDDQKKKKTQALLQRVKRVTVILPQKS